MTAQPAVARPLGWSCFHRPFRHAPDDRQVAATPASLATPRGVPTIAGVLFARSNRCHGTRRPSPRVQRPRRSSLTCRPCRACSHPPGEGAWAVTQPCMPVPILAVVQRSIIELTAPGAAAPAVPHVTALITAICSPCRANRQLCAIPVVDAAPRPSPRLAALPTSPHVADMDMATLQQLMILQSQRQLYAADVSGVDSTLPASTWMAAQAVPTAQEATDPSDARNAQVGKRRIALAMPRPPLHINVPLCPVQLRPCALALLAMSLPAMSSPPRPGASRKPPSHRRCAICSPLLSRCAPRRSTSSC